MKTNGKMGIMPPCARADKTTDAAVRVLQISIRKRFPQGDEVMMETAYLDTGGSVQKTSMLLGERDGVLCEVSGASGH